MDITLNLAEDSLLDHVSRVHVMLLSSCSISYYSCNSHYCYCLIIVVVITDPGIKVDHGYKPYDDGISQGVFIKVCTYVYMYIVAYVTGPMKIDHVSANYIRVIFLLISFVLNAPSHFCKLHKKAH